MTNETPLNARDRAAILALELADRALTILESSNTEPPEPVPSKPVARAQAIRRPVALEVAS